MLNRRFSNTVLGVTVLMLAASLLPASNTHAQGLLDTAMAAGAASGIQIDADETAYDNGVASARGNVHITYGDTEIFAGETQFHQATGNIHCSGGVQIYKGGTAYKSQEAIYNINTEKIETLEMKSGAWPLFYETKSMNTNMTDMDTISMGDSMFTTHDSANPNFRIKAKEMVIYNVDDPQKGRIVFKKATIYAGNTPIMYLPYMSQAIDQDLGYHFLPGFRSNWGAFLLNRYGVMWGDHTLATYRVDLRSNRGVAGGLDLKSMRHADNPNFGNFKFYVANDTNTQETHNGRIREDEVDSTRYRVNLQHRVYLPGPDESTLYADIDFNKISDGYFYEDFFQEEFRIDPQPDNLLNLTKVFPRGTFSILARADVNEFYTTDTRLPEIALDLNTQPIFDTGLFYTGNYSWGIYEESLGTLERQQLERDREKGETRLLDPTAALLKDPEFQLTEQQTMLDEINDRLDDERGFSRYDAYQEMSAPKTLFGWLSVNPKIGFRATGYSDIQGDGADSVDRQAFYAGMDTSFKLSRDMPNVSMPKLGVEGLRHIIQPYIGYSYVKVNEELDPRMGTIDRYAPTTRLRPIDMNQVTAIDEIDNWHVVRPGVFNRWQTKRDGRAYNWLELNTYFDYYIADIEFDRDYSNLFNEIRFRPLPWLSLDLDTQLPVFSSGGDYDFTEINSRVTFMPTDRIEFSIGDRYLSDHPFFEDSNLLETRFYARIGDRLGFSAVHRFEVDDSTMELQQYAVHYDTGAWTLGVGGLIRDHRGTEEYGLILMATLKDIPQISIPIEIDPSGGGN